MSAYRPGNMRGPGEMTPLLLLLLLTSLAGTVLCQSEYEDEPDPEPEAESEPESDVPVDAPEPVPDPELEEEPGDTTGVVEDILTTVPPAVSDDTSSASDTSPSEVSPSATVEEPIEGEHGSGEDLIDSINYFEVGAGPVDDIDSTPSSDEGIDPTVILIPVGLVVVIIAMIVCGILVNRRWNQKMRGTDQRKDDPYLDGCSTEKVPMPMFEEDVPSVLELEMEELDQWISNDGEAEKNSEHT